MNASTLRQGMYSLNYKHQEPDLSDYMSYATTLDVNVSLSLPMTYTLQPKMPPVLDQLTLGGCVANAIAIIVGFYTSLIVSRLYMYFTARALRVPPQYMQDDGVDLRTAFRAVTKYGIVSELEMPYLIMNYTQLPSIQCFKNARLFQKFVYLVAAQNITNLTNLIYNQNPVVFGIAVYESFLTQSVQSTGIVPMPNITTETHLGNHSLVLIGYDNIKKRFTCQNSWGIDFGDKGMLYLPYEYITNPSLCFDLWTLQCIL
uniref:Peptidase C1A papain C-terminal domain-containing protein n=1 Tax=viral metagenome TaxID=1070528 RepID=A0A6C0CQV3_9ZZZZ